MLTSSGAGHIWGDLGGPFLMPQGLIGNWEASSRHIVPVSLDGRTGMLGESLTGRL